MPYSQETDQAYSTASGACDSYRRLIYVSN